jgi:hypothetical protein
MQDRTRGVRTQPHTHVRLPRRGAGFGSPTGEGPCRICPVGSYSPGESTEDCLPCPFGKTSQQGATDASECRPITQQCPAAGQIAPPDAVSEAECRCLPGHGGERACVCVCACV